MKVFLCLLNSSPKKVTGGCMSTRDRNSRGSVKGKRNTIHFFRGPVPQLEKANQSREAIDLVGLRNHEIS